MKGNRKRYRVYNKSKKVGELMLGKFVVVDTQTDVPDYGKLVVCVSAFKEVASLCENALNGWGMKGKV